MISPITRVYNDFSRVFLWSRSSKNSKQIRRVYSNWNKSVSLRTVVSMRNIFNGKFPLRSSPNPILKRSLNRYWWISRKSLSPWRIFRTTTGLSWIIIPLVSTEWNTNPKPWLVSMNQSPVNRSALKIGWWSRTTSPLSAKRVISHSSTSLNCYARTKTKIISQFGKRLVSSR